MKTQEEILKQLIYSLQSTQDVQLGKNILRNTTYPINMDGFDWMNFDLTPEQIDQAIEIMLKEIEKNNIQILELPENQDDSNNYEDPYDPSIPEVEEYLKKIEDYKDEKEVEEILQNLEDEPIKEIIKLLEETIVKDEKWINSYETHKRNRTKTDTIISLEDFYENKKDGLIFIKDELKGFQKKLEINQSK